MTSSETVPSDSHDSSELLACRPEYPGQVHDMRRQQGATMAQAMLSSCLHSCSDAVKPLMQQHGLLPASALAASPR